MATEKRLIYLEDAIALFEQDIEENKVALRTAYYGDKDAIRSEIVGMRTAISLVNSLARNGFTVDAVEVVHGRWIDSYAVDSNGKKVYDSIDCSVCEEVYKIESHDREYWKDRFKRCFCCGAKMDGDGNG